jgi:hypothetical protein
MVTNLVTLANAQAANQRSARRTKNQNKILGNKS